jgi:hypothetical protein
MVYCLCAGFGQARFTDPRCHFAERTYLPAEAKTLDFRLSGAVYREINRAPIKSRTILRRMVRSPRRHAAFVAARFLHAKKKSLRSKTL